MSIPSQLPVIAARAGALQTLALQAGQVLEGKVIGPAPNGATQVQIGRQTLALLLPALVAPGTTLQFQVQGSGTQQRLALLPPPTPTVPMPAMSPAPLPAQATAVFPAQVSTPSPATATPLSPTLATPPSASGLTPPPAPSVPLASAPQPLPTPVGAMPQQPGATPGSPLPSNAAAQPGSPAPGAVATPPPQALPTAQGVPPQAAARTPSQPPPTAAPTSAPSPTPLPSTPQAALTQMVQSSVQRQDSVTGLTTALAAIAGKVPLPEPVIRAAQQVMAGRVPISTPSFDGAALQKAVLGSGVFQEAALARGLPATAQADMKSALLSLRQTLVTWLGQAAPVAQAARIAPPHRGGIPRAHGIDGPPLDPGGLPEDVGKALLERTEAALSRLRLHQHASLPEPSVRGAADWSMDLPVLIGTHQTLMQLQIHRDAHNPGDAPGERGWQLRFALDVPSLGEVGAQVTLRETTTGVMLWAGEAETAAAINAALPELTESLVAAGLQPGTVFCRHGEPPVPAQPPAAGHFVDART